MKLVLWMLAALLALGRPARAQGIDWKAGRLLTDSVETAQRYVERNGLVVLKVTVAGKRYRFLLDTGAPTLVAASLRDRFGLPVLGQTLVYDAYRRADSATVVTLPELGLGPLRLAGVPALVVDDVNPVLEALGVDGILGSNALQQLAVTISSRSRTVVFSARPVSHPATAVPMRTDGDLQGTPELRVAVDGHAAGDFLFDSGFQGLCDLSQAAHDHLATEAAVAIRVVRGEAAFSGLYGDAPSSLQTLQLQSVSVGGIRLERVHSTVSGDTRSKIGAELLQCGAVTLDYRAGLFSLVPYRRQP